MAQLYQDQLKKMLTDPKAFQGTPGFKFALDSGLDAAKRKMASMGMGNSGNALAELTKLGTGMAMQDYGNQVDRLGRLTGQEQQFSLGAYNAGNQFALGQQQNALAGQRDWWNADQGYDQNAMAEARDYNNWNLGRMNADTSRGNMLVNYMRTR